MSVLCLRDQHHLGQTCAEEGFAQQARRLTLGLSYRSVASESRKQSREGDLQPNGNELQIEQNRSVTGIIRSTSGNAMGSDRLVVLSTETHGRVLEDLLSRVIGSPEIGDDKRVARF